MLRLALRCAALLLTLTGAWSADLAQAQAAPQRVLAKGVETTIAPDIVPAETTSAHDLIEIRADQALDWKPELAAKTQTLFAKSQNVSFRRDVWALEFSFKPLRMIWVDVPQPDGTLDRKLVWYLLYRVKNVGAHVRPTGADDGTFTVEAAPAEPITFVPQFVLESQDIDEAGKKKYRAYLDQIIPVAMEAIRRRELPQGELKNSVDVSATPIPVSTAEEDNSVWGVAMWDSVDPQLDHLSVFVGGLTNAYKWKDDAQEYQPGDPIGTGRQMAGKVLQLNFWRPGDEFLQNEAEIRYGVPVGRANLYGVGEGVAHQWIFR